MLRVLDEYAVEAARLNGVLPANAIMRQRIRDSRPMIMCLEVGPRGNGVGMQIKWSIRKRLLALAVLLVMGGCKDALPMRPADPADEATARFSIRFVLANPASLSLSEPAPCSGDWSTCPKGSQPQGPSTIGAMTIKSYVLPSATYRLTGVLRPSTSIGASIDIQIGTGATGNIDGGVAREGFVQLAFVRSTGDNSAGLKSILAKGCGATFSSPSGEFEWSVTFRVIATAQSADQICP